MIVASSVVELTGSRVLRPQPPKGIPPRILNVRLHRCFHFHHQRCAVQSHTDHAAIATNPLALSCFPIRTHIYLGNTKSHSHSYATLNEPAVAITGREYILIQDLLDCFPDGPPKAPVFDKPRYGDAEDATRTELHHVPNPFDKALQAVQQQDTRRLLIYLRKITQLPEEQLQNIFESWPRATFTEFLRLLDPFCVARDADPTDGTNIPAGMYTMLNLDSTIDDWGVRRLYVRLLQRVLVLMKALQATGHHLNAQEYTYLFRCTGAASDIAVAKWIWSDMKRTGDRFWRQSDLYYEFLRARFLTEPMYTGYDKIRRMVLPRNLHRAKLMLSARRLAYSDRLRFKLRSRRFRFGLNKATTEYSEDITRVLRKRKPVRKLFYHVMMNGYAPTERLVCAFLIAFARAGSLRVTGSRILQDFFGIKVTRLNLDEFEISGAVTESRAAPMGCRLRPTVRLMEAVVEAYGCNSEIAVAVQIVDYISRTHKIPVPPQVWLALLEWTHVAGTPPLSTAWKHAGMSNKIPPRDAVEMIWDAMMAQNSSNDNNNHNNNTSDGDNVKAKNVDAKPPSFAHHAVLINHLLGRKMFDRVIPHLRAARRDFEAQARDLEDATFEYVQALRDSGGGSGSHTAVATRALARYERARFRTRAMWYNLQTWTRRLLLRWRPFFPGDGGGGGGAWWGGVKDSGAAYSRFAHRVIPGLVAEFRGPDPGSVLPNPVLYRTPTGYVNLEDPCRELARAVRVGTVAHDVPLPRRWRPGRTGAGAGARAAGHPLRRVYQPKFAVLSSRTLAPQKASRLDARRLLGGHWSHFRTVRVPKRRTGSKVEGQGQAGGYDDYDDD